MNAKYVKVGGAATLFVHCHKSVKCVSYLSSGTFSGYILLKAREEFRCCNVVSVHDILQHYGVEKDFFKMLFETWR